MGQDQDDVVVIPLRTLQRRVTGNQDVRQIQVAAGSGSALTVAKIPLDAASSLSWVTAIAVLLIGGFGFEVWRRKFKKVWDDGEERIAEAIKKAEAAIV